MSAEEAILSLMQENQLSYSDILKILEANKDKFMSVEPKSKSTVDHNLPNISDNDIEFEPQPQTRNATQASTSKQNDEKEARKINELENNTQCNTLANTNSYNGQEKCLASSKEITEERGLGIVPTEQSSKLNSHAEGLKQQKYPDNLSPDIDTSSQISHQNTLDQTTSGNVCIEATLLSHRKRQRKKITWANYKANLRVRLIRKYKAICGQRRKRAALWKSNCTSNASLVKPRIVPPNCLINTCNTKSAPITDAVLKLCSDDSQALPETRDVSDLELCDLDKEPVVTFPNNLNVMGAYEGPSSEAKENTDFSQQSLFEKEFKLNDIQPTKTKDIKKIKGRTAKNVVISKNECESKPTDKLPDDAKFIIPSKPLSLNSETIMKDADMVKIDKSNSSTSAYLSDELCQYLKQRYPSNMIKIKASNLSKSEYISDLLDCQLNNIYADEVSKLNGQQTKYIDTKSRKFAQKRNILAEAVMNSQKRQDLEDRIRSIRKKLTEEDIPFTRRCFTASTNVTNSHSYVIFNGKKIEVASSTNKEVLANINGKTKFHKDSPAKVNPRTVYNPSTCVVQKRCLLDDLRTEVKRLVYKPEEWETLEVKLPKLSLELRPQLGKRIHPALEHLIEDDGSVLSQTRVEFALDTLNFKKSSSILHVYKFPLIYANNQKKFIVQKRILNDVEPHLPTTKPVVTETDSEISNVVTDVVNKLLDYVEISEVTKDIIRDEHKSENKDESTALLSDETKVPQKVWKRRRKSVDVRTSLYKTAMEMKRLSCKIISMSMDEENTELNQCDKEFCKLGCVCKSLQCAATGFLDKHCGLPGCMFECTCDYGRKYSGKNISWPDGSNVFSEGVMNRIFHEANLNLAKEEKEFTQTVIATEDNIIMIDDYKHKKRRATKMPKKYIDFVNVDEDIPTYSSIDRDKPIKPCAVKLLNHDFSTIIPFCMVHMLYKCHCKNKVVFDGGSDVKNIVNCTRVFPPKRRPEPPPLLKLKKLKLSNKELDSSRTRSVQRSDYCIRNKTAGHKSKLVKCTNNLQRNAKIYLRENEKQIVTGDDADELRTLLLEELHSEIFKEPKSRRKPSLTILEDADNDNSKSLTVTHELLSQNYANRKPKVQRRKFKKAMSKESITIREDANSDKPQDKHQLFASVDNCWSIPKTSKGSSNEVTKVIESEAVDAVRGHLKKQDDTEMLIEKSLQQKKIMRCVKRIFLQKKLICKGTDNDTLSGRRILWADVPNLTSAYKWRVIDMSQVFAYLSLARSSYSINYTDIMRVIRLAQTNKSTVVLEFTERLENYKHRNFGIYCVPNYPNKIFVGPYFLHETHDLDILSYHGESVINKKLFNQIQGKPVPGSGLWFYPAESNEDTIDNNNTIVQHAPTIIDLISDSDDDVPDQGKEISVSNLDLNATSPLKQEHYSTLNNAETLGVLKTSEDILLNSILMSSLSENDPHETAKYERALDVLLNTKHLNVNKTSFNLDNVKPLSRQNSLTAQPFNTVVPRIDSMKSLASPYGSISNGAITAVSRSASVQVRSDQNGDQQLEHSVPGGMERYLVTNVHNLGYLFAYQIDNNSTILGVTCPVTKNMKKFAHPDEAISSLERVLSLKVILVPSTFKIKVKLLTKLTNASDTPLDPVVLNGYHIVGNFGVKNIQHSSQSDLEVLGISDGDIRKILNYRKRLSKEPLKFPSKIPRFENITTNNLEVDNDTPPVGIGVLKSIPTATPGKLSLQKIGVGSLVKGGIPTQGLFKRSLTPLHLKSQTLMKDKSVVVRSESHKTDLFKCKFQIKPATDEKRLIKSVPIQIRPEMLNVKGGISTQGQFRGLLPLKFQIKPATDEKRLIKSVPIQIRPEMLPTSQKNFNGVRHQDTVSSVVTSKVTQNNIVSSSTTGLIKCVPMQSGSTICDSSRTSTIETLTAVPKSNRITHRQSVVLENTGATENPSKYVTIKNNEGLRYFQLVSYVKSDSKPSSTEVEMSPPKKVARS